MANTQSSGDNKESGSQSSGNKKESGTQTSEDNKESGEWVSSMETMLASVTSEKVKACSIFGVPKQLGKSEKEAEAYKPKAVSIGPLHRGTKTDLLYMEEIKYHCMLSLLLRIDGVDGADIPKRFAACSKAILKLDDSFRAFYVDDIKFNNFELAKIMLLDGCFLLELLISNFQQSLSDDSDISTTLKSFSGIEFHIKSRSSESDFAAEVRNKGEVLSDLKLIENQIPLLLLISLFQLLFTNDTNINNTHDPVRNTIHGLALLLFGCSPTLVKCEKNRAHLLDLVHTFLTEKVEGNVQEMKLHAITIKTSGERTSEKRTSVKRTLVKRNYETAPELKCCAARLKAATIEIKALEEKRKDDTSDVIFCCYTSFTDKTLEIIHPLNITEETEILWPNLIAWEQNRIAREKYLHRKQERTSCKFSELALLFKDLVCCEHDIKLLKDQNVLIVRNEKKWSNEKLMTFFHTLADGIQIDTREGFKYVQMINDFNAYTSVSASGKSGMFGHKCRRVMTNTSYTLRRWLAILKRDHTPTVWKTIGVIAAVVLLLLTVAQTVLSSISL